MQCQAAHPQARGISYPFEGPLRTKPGRVEGSIRHFSACLLRMWCQAGNSRQNPPFPNLLNPQNNQTLLNPGPPRPPPRPPHHATQSFSPQRLWLSPAIFVGHLRQMHGPVVRGGHQVPPQDPERGAAGMQWPQAPKKKRHAFIQTDDSSF